MKQEDKELLLKDLCARLPYGVIVTNNCIQGKLLSIETNIPNTEEIVYFRILSSSIVTDTISNIKSYLRPMSSMTEEEFKELTIVTELQYDQLELKDWDNGVKTLEFYIEEIPHYCVIKVFDWLNEHHFDFRNLIEKGLAIDCTNLNIY